MVSAVAAGVMAAVVIAAPADRREIRGTGEVARVERTIAIAGPTANPNPTATATATATPTPTSTSTATPTSTATSTATATAGSPAVPDLPLADALDELDRQNLTLAQARARAEEAAAIASQAEAALLPGVAAQASWVWNSDEAVLAIGPVPALGLPRIERVIQPKEALSVAGTVRVPLVVPGAWYDVAGARSGARAARASAEAVRRQLRAGFAQAAQGAASADEVVLASERAVESAREHARSAERRVQAGTAPPLDLFRARTELVRRESDLARARAERARGQLALGVLLGREGPVRVLVPDPPAEEPGDETGALREEALARRPELAAQRAQVEAADAAIRSTWARLAPQLSASASLFAQDVAYPTGEKDGWRASLDLTWPIFDGGLREARRRQARAQRASAGAAEAAQRLAVVQEVSDGTRDVAVARERLRLAVTQRQLAADAAASARRSFEAGVASSLDVVDANDRLYQADVGLAEARAPLAQSHVGLERALGR